MKWKAFEHDGKTYDLKHLDPQTAIFDRPAEAQRSGEKYTVQVTYASHCFTRAPRLDEQYDTNLVYPHDDYEKRLFDQERYELSKRLPEIIQGLPFRKVIQNNEHKFFTIELVTDGGESVEYDIFFKVKKKAKGLLELIVESGFVRDPLHQSSRPKGKPVRFWIILHNTLHGRKIRA